jgi:hypothetical protein
VTTRGANDVSPPARFNRSQSHLSNPEFEKVFKMNRAKFYQQPKWKREQLKKSAGLF